MSNLDLPRAEESAMSTYSTPCLLVNKPDHVALSRYDIPPLMPNEVLIDIEVSGISPGTELREMSVYGKQTSRPFVPGYAAVGRVVAASPGQDAWIGRRVFTGGTRSVAPFEKRWGGHVARAVTPIERLVPLPDLVDTESAALTKIAAIALHGLRHARVSTGDRLIVVGLGVIGQCSARLAVTTGASVWALDTSAERVRRAREAGLEASVVDDHTHSDLLERTAGGADVVIDTTGVPQVLTTSTRLLRGTDWGSHETTGPRLVIQGSFAADFRLVYDDLFQREATVLIPRDNMHADLVEVIGHLNDRRLTLADLISATVEPRQAQDLYQLLQQDTSILTGCIRWS